MIFVYSDVVEIGDVDPSSAVGYVYKPTGGESLPPPSCESAFNVTPFDWLLSAIMTSSSNSSLSS